MALGGASFKRSDSPEAWGYSFAAALRWISSTRMRLIVLDGASMRISAPAKAITNTATRMWFSVNASGS